MPRRAATTPFVYSFRALLKSAQIGREAEGSGATDGVKSRCPRWKLVMPSHSVDSAVENSAVDCAVSALARFFRGSGSMSKAPVMQRTRFLAAFL